MRAKSSLSTSFHSVLSTTLRGRHDDPILHLRMLRLRIEVTCPKCQRQNSPKLRSVVAVKVHSEANFVSGTG